MLLQKFNAVGNLTELLSQGCSIVIEATAEDITCKRAVPAGDVLWVAVTVFSALTVTSPTPDALIYATAIIGLSVVADQHIVAGQMSAEVSSTLHSGHPTSIPPSRSHLCSITR